jgi:hypothetical protein
MQCNRMQCRRSEVETVELALQCVLYVMAALSVLSQRVDPRAELRASTSVGIRFPALMSSAASCW